MESHHPSNQFKLIPLKTPGPQMPTILYEGVRMLSPTAEMNISEMKTHLWWWCGHKKSHRLCLFTFWQDRIFGHMCIWIGVVSMTKIFMIWVILYYGIAIFNSLLCSSFAGSGDKTSCMKWCIKHVLSNPKNYILYKWNLSGLFLFGTQ